MVENLEEPSRDQGVVGGSDGAGSTVVGGTAGGAVVGATVSCGRSVSGAAATAAAD